MVRMKGGVMKGLSRLPDDGYEECTASDLEMKLGGDVWLKSKLHGYQTIDFIERTLGPNQATHRLRDYVGESRGYNQDTHSAYRGVGHAASHGDEATKIAGSDTAPEDVPASDAASRSDAIKDDFSKVQPPLATEVVAPPVRRQRAG
ncbi:hypothetical protein ACVWXQ_000017 [Bradyrhizobium sp. S3.14.4]